MISVNVWASNLMSLVLLNRFKSFQRIHVLVWNLIKSYVQVLVAGRFRAEFHCSQPHLLMPGYREFWSCWIAVPLFRGKIWPTQRLACDFMIYH